MRSSLDFDKGELEIVSKVAPVNVVKVESGHEI